MQNLNNYKKIVGDKLVNEILQKAKKFSKKHIVCISSTHQGGGVAEILNTAVLLFNEIGIDFGWRIIHGTPDFFSITKQIHNALQGGSIYLSEKEKQIYIETNRRFSTFTHLNHDLVIIHDPQPLPLINFYKKRQPWVFRCHIDLSTPDGIVWNYLKTLIKKYDHFIVSAPTYKKQLPINQSIIYPAIDPFSLKNKPLTEKQIDKYLKSLKINFKKPIISQISRFDKWKDPEGVIKIFQKVKKYIDCQLVLLGNIAIDDPEGIKIYNRIMKKHGGQGDIHILMNVRNNDYIVNALQRKSSVIIQKSLKEGFGLTISEALYKTTPVVGSNIGGIPLQIINNYNGFLHQPQEIDRFAESVIQILKDKKLKKRLGENGKQYVKNNFLTIRLINDWLDIFEKYL